MKPSLFSTIDGRGGESLATSVLGTLLESSPQLGASFCAMLSRKYQKDISAVDLKAEFERHTDDNGEKGRIDLLVITQNFAIGIECKLLHFLGDRQPEKYRKAVSAVRSEYLLLVLVPKSGENQARSALEKQGLVANEHLITWDAVLNELVVTSNVDYESLFLAKELRSFIREYVGALDSFEGDYDAIFGAGNNQSKREHYLFALRPFFTVPGQRFPTAGASSGKWKGMTFIKTTGDIEGWYGFVSATQLPRTVHPPGVEWRLVIGLSAAVLRASSLELDACFVTCNDVNGCNSKWWKTWIVTPNQSSFASDSHWQSMLQPILVGIDAALAARPVTRL